MTTKSRSRGEKLRPLPWWEQKFLADEHVIMMSLEAEGAYRRLLGHEWLHGSIPADVRAQAAICKGIQVSRMRKIWQQLAPCFHALEDPSRLYNGRLETIRQEDDNYRSQKAAAGRKGMATRWKDDNNVDNSDHNTVITDDTTDGLTDVYPPSPSPTPTTAKASSSARARAGVPELYQEDFDALRRASHAPDALDREIQALLSGQHPTLGALTPEDVGVGIRELSLAGAPASKLSRFVAVARDRRANPTSARRGKPPEPESFEAAAARAAAEGR